MSEGGLAGGVDAGGGEHELAALGVGQAGELRVSDAANNLVDNENYKRCVRVEIPDFVGTYDDYWMLVDSSKPVKAIARQVRKDPKPIMDTRPEEVELTNEVRMFAHGRAAAAGAMPHLAYAARL